MLIAYMQDLQMMGSETCIYKVSIQTFASVAVSKISNHVVQKTRLNYKAKATCDEGLLMNQAETNFRNQLEHKVAEYCNPRVMCSLGRIDAACIDKNTYENDPFDLEMLSNQITHKAKSQEGQGQGSGRKRVRKQAEDEDTVVELKPMQRDDPDLEGLGPDESSVRFQFEVSGEYSDGPV